MKPIQSARRLAHFATALLSGLLALPSVVTLCEAGEAPGAGERTMVVYLHQSGHIDAPWPVKRVSVADPKVADVQVLTPRQVLVLGRMVGSTDVILWSEKEEVLRVEVDVVVDLRRLRAELEKFLPQSDLNVTESRGFVVVQGVVDRAEAVVALHQYLEAWGLKYVDMTKLAGVQQVLLKVRMAEVSRVALRELGINGFHTGHDFFAASNLGGINPASIGVPSGAAAARDLPFQFIRDVDVNPAVTFFTGFPQADVQLFLQALADNQFLRMLAEPTLVALSGEEANFLAGGEFPVPVAQASGAGTAISVEYREYGVRLKFRPTVLGDGIIRLQVAPEVSELSEAGGVQAEGFIIPGVVTRRAETTLEMKSGQTFAMAGLISANTSARNLRLPVVGDLPVLGALFRSVRYRRSETELVVLVTISLVEPLSEAEPPPLPGVLHVRPNEWELYLKGRLEGKAPAKLSPADAAALEKMGLTHLLGPGGWESYDQGVARSQATTRPEPPAAPSAPGETDPTAAQPQPQPQSTSQ